MRCVSLGFPTCSSRYPSVSVSGGYTTWTETGVPLDSMASTSPRHLSAALVGAYAEYPYTPTCPAALEVRTSVERCRCGPPRRLSFSSSIIRGRKARHTCAVPR